jgi:mRNA-degrading endonuclease RelE of RelBE toxin-antitoxin system
VTDRRYTLEFRPVAMRQLRKLQRIRVGDFRIVYTITDEALVITVVRVANRREVYRGT